MNNITVSFPLHSMAVCDDLLRKYDSSLPEAMKIVVVVESLPIVLPYLWSHKAAEKSNFSVSDAAS